MLIHCKIFVNLFYVIYPGNSPPIFSTSIHIVHLLISRLCIHSLLHRNRIKLLITIRKWRTLVIIFKIRNFIKIPYLKHFIIQPFLNFFWSCTSIYILSCVNALVDLIAYDRVNTGVDSFHSTN